MSHPTGKLHRNSPERLWGKFSLYNILHSHTALNEQVTHWCSNLWLRRLVVRALDLQLTVMSSNPCNIAICRFFKVASAAVLNLENFTFLTVGQECRTTSLCQILSKSFEPRPRYVSFNIMLIWLENAYSRPFFEGFGAHFPQMMSLIVLTPKGPSLG